MLSKQIQELKSGDSSSSSIPKRVIVKGKAGEHLIAKNVCT